MKFLSPRVHGAIDYLFAALFLLAPTIFRFDGLPATLATGIAVAQLTLAMCTAYPLGLVKAVPFPAHGWIELFMGTSIILAPWIFNFSESLAARNFFLGAGVAWLLVWLVSEYVASQPRMRSERHSHDD
jgi:hypothetical protein